MKSEVTLDLTEHVLAATREALLRYVAWIEANGLYEPAQWRAAYATRFVMWMELEE